MRQMVEFTNEAGVKLSGNLEMPESGAPRDSPYLPIVSPAHKTAMAHGAFPKPWPRGALRHCALTLPALAIARAIFPTAILPAIFPICSPLRNICVRPIWHRFC